jgi:hypothetical protein
MLPVWGGTGCKMAIHKVVVIVNISNLALFSFLISIKYLNPSSDRQLKRIGSMLWADIPAWQVYQPAGMTEQVSTAGGGDMDIAQIFSSLNNFSDTYGQIGRQLQMPVLPVSG